MKSSSENISVYINNEQLKKLLSDPLFIAFASKEGKTIGGTYYRSNVIFRLKKKIKV